MPINIQAACDGPDCSNMELMKSREWPMDWLVIDVVRSRHIKTHTGRFGFCSDNCFERWAVMAVSNARN